jgi:hypothetical protein
VSPVLSLFGVFAPDAYPARARAERRALARLILAVVYLVSASPIILKTNPPWAPTVPFRISSWRARARCILCVPLPHGRRALNVGEVGDFAWGGLSTNAGFPFPLAGHHSALEGRSEVEDIQVAGYLYGSAECHLCLRGKLPEVDEPARPEMGQD